MGYNREKSLWGLIMDEIQGMVQEIVFRNEVNGYTVIEITDDRQETP